MHARRVDTARGESLVPVPLPDDDHTLTQALMRAVMLRSERAGGGQAIHQQLRLHCELASRLVEIDQTLQVREAQRRPPRLAGHPNILVRPSAVAAQRAETGFLDRVVTVAGVTHRYQVYVPAAYADSAGNNGINIANFSLGRRDAPLRKSVDCRCSHASRLFCV